jgi:phosphopantetheinyl transferase (holo-ACP synthase)
VETGEWEPPWVILDSPPPADWAVRLTPGEREQQAGYPAEKRRQDWLLGRLAAKEALREAWSRAGHGAVPDWQAFSVGTLPSGAPDVVGLDPPLAVSLSHGHGRAVSWACPPGAEGALPGVDLERIKARPAGTFRFYLHSEERAWLDGLEGAEKGQPPRARDVAAIVLWALKEAAFKALRPPRGTGLLDVSVQEVSEFAAPKGGARLAYRDGAFDRARGLGVHEVRAGWRRDGDLILAWVEARGGRLS